MGPESPMKWDITEVPYYYRMKQFQVPTKTQGSWILSVPSVSTTDDQVSYTRGYKDVGPITVINLYGNLISRRMKGHISVN